MKLNRKNKFMRTLAVIIVLTFVLMPSGALAEQNEFSYVHDPRENPSAMKDVVENPDAVYGFSPDPESERLGTFAEYDWTDPKVVEEAHQTRVAYHESFQSMYDMLFEMRDAGKSIEEMARAVSAERNRLRLEAGKDDPEALAKTKESNLAAYGNEEGPTADSLYEKYGSWEVVIQKAFGTNAGMDACCGLYDEYYELYVELGMIPEQAECDIDAEPSLLPQDAELCAR